MAINGNFGYVSVSNPFDGTGFEGLKVFDLTDPQIPVETGNLSLAEGADWLKIQGSYLYAPQGGVISIIDISNPALPAQVNTLNGDFIAIQNNRGYLSDGTSLKVLDLTDSAQPAELGSLNINLGLVAVQGNRLYGVGNGALKAIDVANDASPLEIGSLSISTPASRALDVQGDYVFLVDQSLDNLRIFDVSNPAAITEVQSVDGGNLSHGRVAGNYYYLLDAAAKSIVVVRLSEASVIGLDLNGDLRKTPIVDNQILSFDNNTLNLSIEDGNTVDLSSIDTDDQTLSLAGDQLSISEGNSISLITVDDQILFLVGNELGIERGNSVDLSSIDTDDQTLSFADNILSISEGNTVDLSSIDTDTDDQTLSYLDNELSILGGFSGIYQR